MSDFRILQLTNTNIGAVAADTAMPLGAITRKFCCGNSALNTFAVGTTGSDYIQVNSKGYYKVLYNVSAVAGAAGVVTLELVVNGTTVLTSSATATAAGDTVNLTIPYEIRVLPNCNCISANTPVTIRIINTGVALTGGISNIIVSKDY